MDLQEDYLLVLDKMKNFRYILLIFLLIGLASCESPLNVPANRNVDITTDPFLNPPISATPSYINLGFVHPDSQVVIFINVANNLDKVYIIWDYNLYFNKNGFSVNNKIVPIILEPKDNESSKAQINILFTAKNSGYYLDTLLFADLLYPFCLLEAKVPNLYFDNVVFESNNPSTKSILIHNTSESNITITNAYFTNETKSFSILTSFPIQVNRNSVYNLQISYTPISEESEKNKLIFQFNGASDRKLADSICNITIVK
jgi:hypothetical protein